MRVEMSNLSVQGECDELLRFLSRERLAPLRKLVGSDAAGIVLHERTMGLAAALMPIVGTLEIAIRNASCEALDQTFGTEDWLFNPPHPFTWKGHEDSKIKLAHNAARRAAYAKLASSQKNGLDAVAFPQGIPPNIKHEKHRKKRQEAIAVTRGQIIAQLTLFFWKRLFSSDYESTLWKRALKSVFPNKTITRPTVAAHLEVLYACRNRIAHHEPVIGARLDETLASVEFVCINLGRRVPDPDAPLAKLIRPRIAEVAIRKREIDAVLSGADGARDPTAGPPA